MHLKSASYVLMAGTFMSMNVSLLLHGSLLLGDRFSQVRNPVSWLKEPQSEKFSSSPRFPIVPAISACLYIMDDNHYLIEWLAYHYHTTNLRNVIVTIDPGSRTSPIPVFDRWKGLMNVTVWTDTDFLSENFDQDLYRRIHGSDGRTKKDPTLQYHRARQANFNLQCLKEHKRKNRGWTMVIDTDEYMTHNPELAKIKVEHSNKTMWNVSEVGKPGSIAAILDQIAIPNPYFDDVTTSCVPVYRRQFAAKESPDWKIDETTPPDFDGRSFQTIRWRKYGSRRKSYTTRTGKKCFSNDAVPNKVIIDLGRLRLQDLDHPQNTGNPHLPLEAICPSNVYLAAEDTPLMVHHYMGTMEQWLYRVGDKRGKNR
jgi:hypothetical protein